MTGGCRSTLGRASCTTNAGYVLLAEAVSRLADRPVSQLARDLIFEPLGMTTTRLGGEPRRTAGQPDPPGTIGDGGLWTSATDLTAWLAAMNDGMLSPGAVRLAEIPGYLADGTVLDYAWGVRIAQTPNGRRLTHGGTWANWLAKTVRFPERRVAVAIVSTEGSEAAISELGTQLAATVLKGKPGEPVEQLSGRQTAGTRAARPRNLLPSAVCLGLLRWPLPLHAHLGHDVLTSSV
jgi:CubicO group peptidase (beta-lactamase class C family)